MSGACMAVLEILAFANVILQLPRACYTPRMINPELLEILACPVCKSDIEHDEAASVLRCALCKPIFPLQDGIPNIVIEEPPVR